MTHSKVDLHHNKDEEAQQIMAAMMDPQAFGPLYDRFAPPIYAYLLSRLGNVDEAMDVTLQTFLTAFEVFPKGCFRAPLRLKNTLLFIF